MDSLESLAGADRQLPAGLPAGLLPVEIDHTSVDSTSEAAEIIRAQLEIVEHMPEAKRPAAWRQLQEYRDMTNFNLRDEAAELNRTLVRMVYESQVEKDPAKLEVARSLMTPSSWEMTILTPVLLDMGLPEDDRQHVNDLILKLNEEKAAAFDTALLDYGLDYRRPEDDLVIVTLRDKLLGADQLQGVPVEFWKTFSALPYKEQAAILSNTRHLAHAAEAVQTLATNDLLDHVETSLATMIRLESSAMPAYAQSLQAARTVLEQRPEAEQDWRSLERFADPEAALKLAQKLDLDLYSVGYILSGSYDEAAVIFQPYAEDMLVALHQSVQAKLGHLYPLSHAYQAVEAAPNPAAYSAELAQAFTVLQGHVDTKSFPLVIRHPHPLELAQAIQPYMERLEALPEQASLVVRSQLGQAGTSPDYLKRFFGLVDYADSIGLQLNEQHMRFLVVTFAGNLGDEARPWIRSQADREDIRQAVKSTNAKTVIEAVLGIDSEPASEQLKDYPKLAEIFNDIGIPPDMAERLFTTWSSYSVTSAALKNAQDALPDNAPAVKISDLEAKHWEFGINSKVDTLTAQVTALRSYVGAYGVDETIAHHRVFRTSNFERLTPEQFHNQLVRWNSSEPTRAIAAVSATDHSYSFNHIGEEVYDLFGEEGTFLFEMHSKSDVSRDIVRVGHRERQHGRDPQTDPTVRYVLIGGHGNSDLIEAGVDIINTSDYMTAAEGRTNIGTHKDKVNKQNARPNDYRRHIGDQYDVILAACSSAGDNLGQDNIATTVSEGHQVTTHGATEGIIAIAEITAEGRVVYRTNPGPAEENHLLGQVHLGREPTPRPS